MLWWRAVGATPTAFAIECWIDEFAHAAGAAPLAYRLDLLTKAPRYAAALERPPTSPAGPPRRRWAACALAVFESSVL